MSARKSGSLRVVSWNVNGLRACAREGFADWLAQSRAEIVGVQEVRALRDELLEAVCAPRGWHTCFSPAVKRGYSGVGLFARREPDAVETSLGDARFDDGGRLQIARFGRLVVLNGYFPKGSGNARDNSRVPYKLDFYRALVEKVRRTIEQALRKNEMTSEESARPREALRAGPPGIHLPVARRVDLLRSLARRGAPVANVVT